MLGISRSHLRFIRCLRRDPCRSLASRWHRNGLIFRNFSRYRVACACHSKFRDPFATAKRISIGGTARAYSRNPDAKCWNCNKSLEILKFSCLNCGVLQYPNPEMTYFELMDLPLEFDVDQDDISTKYKALQMMFHPDKYVRRSKEEMEISDHYSRLVNKAYSTLRNPLTRGMYILNLNGIPTDDDSVKMNQEFLLEILEKNEELESIQDIKSLQDLSYTNSRVIKDFVSKASNAFQAKDLNTAREALMKLKYFVNIEQEIKKKKSIMGIVD